MSDRNDWGAAGDGVGDGFTGEERKTAELVKALRSTGNLGPLVTMLRESNDATERARDALLMLGELDLELLVRVSLDTLTSDHANRPIFAPARAGKTGSGP